ncbi:unnamed protein product [Urochloa humidicola]
MLISGGGGRRPSSRIPRGHIDLLMLPSGVPVLPPLAFTPDCALVASLRPRLVCGNGSNWGGFKSRCSGQGDRSGSSSRRSPCIEPSK